MNCEVAQEHLSALVDGELDAATAREVSTHAASCSACRQELEELRATIAGLAEVCTEMHADAPPLPADVRARLAARPRPRREWTLGRVAALAAAAVVMVSFLVRWAGRDETTPDELLAVLDEALAANWIDLRVEEPDGHETWVRVGRAGALLWQPGFEGRKPDPSRPIVGWTGTQAWIYDAEADTVRWGDREHVFAWSYEVLDSDRDREWSGAMGAFRALEILRTARAEGRTWDEGTLARVRGAWTATFAGPRREEGPASTSVEVALHSWGVGVIRLFDASDDAPETPLVEAFPTESSDDALGLAPADLLAPGFVEDGSPLSPEMLEELNALGYAGTLEDLGYQ